VAKDEGFGACHENGYLGTIGGDRTPGTLKPSENSRQTVYPKDGNVIV